MTRIRQLKSPRVEPPKDRPVLIFRRTRPDPYVAITPLPPDAIAWCEPPTLTKPSGPVHSLEPEELPEPGEIVLVRMDGAWRTGARAIGEPGVWHVHTFVRSSPCEPDAWRPLPDDEPEDAELLEAAKAWSLTHGAGEAHISACAALRILVEKRIRKEKL